MIDLLEAAEAFLDGPWLPVVVFLTIAAVGVVLDVRDGGGR